MKNGIEYFPINTNFFDDDKIALVEVDHGFLGSYILLRIISKIYDSEGYYCHWGEDERKLFVKRVGGNDLDIAKLDAIVESGLNRDFFDRTMFDKYQILTSRGIQKRFFEAVSRRKAQVYSEYILMPEARSKYANIEFISLSEESAKQQSETSPAVDKTPAPAETKTETPKEEKTTLSDETLILKQFFFSNFLKPEEELEKFIRNNELMHARDGGWAKMSSTTRLAASMEWRQLDSNKKPITEVRFNKEKRPFFEAWKELFLTLYEHHAPENIIREMFSDKVNWVNRVEYMGKLRTPFQLHGPRQLLSYLQDHEDLLLPVLSPILGGKKFQYIEAK